MDLSVLEQQLVLLAGAPRADCCPSAGSGGSGCPLHRCAHVSLRLSFLQDDSFAVLLLSLTPVIKRLDFLKYQHLLAPWLTEALQSEEEGISE